MQFSLFNGLGIYTNDISYFRLCAFMSPTGQRLPAGGAILPGHAEENLIQPQHMTTQTLENILYSFIDNFDTLINLSI